LVSVIVNAIGTIDAGTSHSVEGGSTTMNATIPDRTGIEGEWTIVSGGADIIDPDQPNTFIENLSRGPNVFSWSVYLGNCYASDTVTVTNGDVVQAETNPDFTTCSLEALLEANDPENALGYWSTAGVGSGDILDPNSPVTRVINLDPDENHFVWTISYGPGSASSSDVIVVTNNSPDVARAQDVSPICENFVTLEGNRPAVGMGTQSWKRISGGGTVVSPDSEITEVTGLSQGNNRFVYTIQKGNCFSTDTVTVINGTPTTPIAGRDTTICQDSLLLDPNVPNHGVGEWKVLDGEAEFKDNDNMAHKIGHGENRFLWVVSTGYCSLEDTVKITNNEPSEAYAGEDKPVCSEELILSGSLPTRHTGEWELISGGGSIQDSTSANSLVTNLAQGENRFRWTITNGECSDFDDVVIRNDFIEASIRYNDPDAICEDSVEITANNPTPGTGTWGVVGGAGSASYENPESSNTIVRDLQQGENILTWSITNGHCTDVDQVSIVSNKPTTADAGGNKATCDNFITMAANNHGFGEDGEWAIRNGSGSFSSLTDPAARVDDLKFGANIFRWTIDNQGCESFDDVQIDFNRLEASAGKDSTLCSDTGILQAASASPGTGTWTVAGGASQASFDDINNANTTVRNLRKGDNTLRWTVNYRGCQTTSEVTLNNASPSRAHAGNTQRLCGSETVLDAMLPEIGVGRWERVSGSATIASADVNAHNAPVTGLAKGENVLRWVVENDICSSEDEVLIVNNLPSTPYAGSDLVVCDPEHDLVAAFPEYGDGFWSIVGGGGNIADVTQPQTSIRNLRPGRNVLKWTLTKGQCTLSDEIVIENNTATPANAGPDVADCKDWAQLDANPPLQGTGEWYIVSGIGVYDSNADESTIIRDLGFGENILMWEIWNGTGEDRCFSRDTVVIFNKVPEQSDAGNDKEFCDNYTTLNANMPPDEAVGAWTVVSGAGEFESPNAYSSIVRNIGFGNNVYKWSIAYDDCVTESTVTIKSNKTDAYAGEDVVVYDPEVILNANNVGDLNASWSIVGGTGDFEDPVFFNTLVEGLSEGINTYRWIIDVNGCSSYDDVSVEYRPVPDAGFITNNAEGCWPLMVLFTNYSVGAQDRDYHWDFGDGNASGDQNPTHIFESEGNYPVVLTVPGPDGIEGRYQKIIRVYGHPEAAFSVMPEEVYVPGDEVRFFDLSMGAIDYEWHFGDGTISNVAHPVHEYSEGGVYDVMLHVTNEFGCVDSTTIEGAVTAISKGFLKFPNAFKPRPDGGSANRASETNNIFKPVYRDVDTYNMQVYNRWGQLIFESNDIDEGWNGIYKGQLAPQAVYVWKVSGTFINGREYRESGSVLLVR
jgi:gliding motility-associated-like protein